MTGGKFLLGISGMLMLMAAVSASGTTDELVHMHFGDRDRTYRIHVPALLGTRVALVVALHGGGGTAAATVKMTGFDAEADRERFIVIYPNGTDHPRPLMNLVGKPGFLTWNAGNCCGYALENHVDDVGFIRAAVKQVENRYPIDPKRIYATGISNGGMMAYTMACEASDMFAAVGIVSGIIADPSCKPSQPVSVIHFHGSADQNIPINGGVGSKAFIKDKRPPVQDSIDFWVQADGCNTKPQESNAPGLDIKSYDGCRANTAVIYYIIQDGGHSWPGGDRLSALLDPPSQAISATDVMWRFFAAHPKP
jgi:polyhydroxybutyrate depolymerase